MTAAGTAAAVSARPSASQPDRAARAADAGTWLLATAAIALAGAAWLSRLLTVDSYYDLFAGRYIAVHGLPHANLVTVAAHGAGWVDQQWLAHLAYYGAWRAGGYPAVAALSAAALTAGLTVLAAAMLRRGVPPERMFAWTLAAGVVCLGNYQVQAQDLAYPLFAGTLWLVLDDSRARPAPLPSGRRIWLVIPVLVVWANVHGSVLLGAGLAAGYALYQAAAALARRHWRALRRYLALGAAAAAAVLCTPYGLAVAGYYRHVVFNPVLSHYIGRWAPPSPADPRTLAFLVVVGAVAAALAVAWRRGARPDPVLGAATLVLLVLALLAARNEDWFAIAGALVAADALAGARTARAAGMRPAFARAVAGLLAALAAASLAVLAATPVRQFEVQVPVGAVAAAARIAASEPAAHVLGDAATGTAMLWLRPAMFGRVGFDVRFEQYPQPALRAYFDYLFVRGPGWAAVTRGYQVLTIARNDARLIRAASRLAGWRLAYADRDGVVLVRG